MDTLLITISGIERQKDEEGFIDENEVRFYRQEIPMWKIQQDKPHLLREIIALCNDLTFKE
jgi:hypothetical protein